MAVILLNIACALMDRSVYTSAEEKRRLAPCITQDGEDRECGPDQYITGIRKKCIVGYKYFCFKECRQVRLTVRGEADGILHIRTEEDGADVAALPVKLEGADWRSVTGDFGVRADKCGFYLEYEGEGSLDLLRIEFV
ncbi:MAG: hypothetical protein NC086_01040 [Alistipes sp.]|nr:hypothetical protein [Alistipes sp.]